MNTFEKYFHIYYISKNKFGSKANQYQNSANAFQTIIIIIFFCNFLLVSFKIIHPYTQHILTQL